MRVVSPRAVAPGGLERLSTANGPATVGIQVSVMAGSCNSVGAARNLEDIPSVLPLTRHSGDGFACEWRAGREFVPILVRGHEKRTCKPGGMTPRMMHQWWPDLPLLSVWRLPQRRRSVVQRLRAPREAARPALSRVPRGGRVLGAQLGTAGYRVLGAQPSAAGDRVLGAQPATPQPPA